MCKAGDRGAFGELVRRYEKRVYYMGLRNLRDGDESWDFSQEVFLRAYRGIQTFRGASSFKTWLYAIAMNLLRNYIRTKKRSETVPLDGQDIPVDADHASDTSRSEVSELLQTAIGRLPYMQRMALTLRIYDDLSHREIAEILGTSEGSVKVNFHYALKALKRSIPEEVREDSHEV